VPAPPGGRAAWSSAPHTEERERGKSKEREPLEQERERGGRVKRKRKGTRIRESREEG
jgi:hypothetical protein